MAASEDDKEKNKAVSESEHKMPVEFWVQPELLIKDASVKLMYAEVAAQLRDECEARGGDVLDYMLAERSAALYGYIRDRETTAGFANDRNRKETLQLWVSLATTVKKAWAADEESKIAARTAALVTKCMSVALETIPYDYRGTATETLREELSAAGL